MTASNYLGNTTKVIRKAIKKMGQSKFLFLSIFVIYKVVIL